MDLKEALKQLKGVAQHYYQRALKTRDPDALQAYLGKLQLIRRHLHALEKTLLPPSKWSKPIKEMLKNRLEKKARSIPNEEALFNSLKARAHVLWKDIISSIKNLMQEV